MRLSKFFHDIAIALTLVCAASSMLAHADRIVIPRAVADSSNERQRLINPGFEQGATGWTGWMQGFEPVEKGGRNGSRGVRCVAGNTQAQHGASQLVKLEQRKPCPIIVTGWSRAEHVDGAADTGYAIYLDINYKDGDHLWALTANFSVGTHDWEQRRVTFAPDKAVESLTVHALFRGHNGTAYFDDFSLVEVRGNGAMFEGVLVSDFQPPAPSADTLEIGSKAGLALSVNKATGAMSSLRLNGARVGENGFPPFVRDAAADSAFVSPEWRANRKDGGIELAAESDSLGLRLSLAVTARDGLLDVAGRVKDLRGADRAVTVYVPLPVSGEWTWSKDVRRDVPAKGRCFEGFRTGAGATGSRSSYPLAVLTGPKGGIALAVPIDEPRHHRLVYDADHAMFYAAFDLGLSPETKKSPGEATFRALVFSFDPKWRFRAALDRYYRLFPAAFEKRVPREGLWMAFTDISTLPNPDDFGFAYQEGATNIAWNRQHGILSFPYTEPMTTWFKLAKDVPRTYDGAVGYLQSLLEKKDDPQHVSATVIAVSSVRDHDSRRVLSVVNAPWCDGCVFALDADPSIPVTESSPVNRGQFEVRRLEKAVTNQLPADGAYIDSYEFWANSIDYDRAHFANVDIPLVFDAQSGRVGVLTAFSTFAFERELATCMHAHGKLMMANDVFASYDFPTAYLDVLGTETNWMPGGKWQPMTDAELCFRRALCFQKPYCFLMNTHFADFTIELTERYMQRALFYGMFPSFFSENAATDCYFANPKWYEPARPLFKKYLPLIQSIAKAGWQPITLAKTDNPRVYIERFGQPKDGAVYFTVLNDSEQACSACITVDFANLGWREKAIALREMLSGTSPAFEKGAIALNLKPEQAALLKLN